ncbi:MAG TPA: ferrous iron transport protein A [Anaerolineae bacterium]|nr:ferrous iron transport protein A [Anaerolineae bacterium]
MAEIKPLSELKPGQRGRVVKVGGSGAIHRRILDMGVVPGAEIEVERVAPLADPVEFKLLGYHLSLRKEEARNVHVEVS